MRDASELFTEFDASESVTTTPTGINSKRTIAGYDREGGFIRYPSGTLTPLNGLWPSAINDPGTTQQMFFRHAFTQARRQQQVLLRKVESVGLRHNAL